MNTLKRGQPQGEPFRTGPGKVATFTKEDELTEMLEELPDERQIAALVGALSIKTLRLMMADLLKHSVQVSKSPELYPYEFVGRLSSWIVTAQETVASKHGISRVLQDRDELRNSN